MVSVRDSVLFVVALLSLSLVAPAQAELDVGGKILPAGGEAQISYSNPALAGSTVVVHVDDGSGGDSQLVLIQLNCCGQGENTWSVPLDWEVACFWATDSHEVMRLVGEPEN